MLLPLCLYTPGINIVPANNPKEESFCRMSKDSGKWPRCLLLYLTQQGLVGSILVVKKNKKKKTELPDPNMSCHYFILCTSCGCQQIREVCRPQPELPSGKNSFVLLDNLLHNTWLKVNKRYRFYTPQFGLISKSLSTDSASTCKWYSGNGTGVVLSLYNVSGRRMVKGTFALHRCHLL